MPLRCAGDGEEIVSNPDGGLVCPACGLAVGAEGHPGVELWEGETKLIAADQWPGGARYERRRRALNSGPLWS